MQTMQTIILILADWEKVGNHLPCCNWKLECLLMAEEIKHIYPELRKINSISDKNITFILILYFIFTIFHSTLCYSYN